MKNVKGVISILGVVLLTGCFLKKDEILPACQTGNTAEVYFVNKSNTGKSYDVIWDGVKMATVASGQESQKFTVTAVVTHTLLFRVAGTSTIACSQSSPSIPQCQAWSYSCSY